MDEADGTINMALTSNVTDKIRKTDIIIELEPMSDRGSLRSSTGTADKNLFTGKNTLHAIMDTQTCLWRLEYEMGMVPPVFNQRFTSWTKLLTFVKDYYAKRNTRIKNILD